MIRKFISSVVNFQWTYQGIVYQIHWPAVFIYLFGIPFVMTLIWLYERFFG